MTDDREVRDYLAALDHALRDVPRTGRAEVLRDVRGHVEEARADEPGVPVRVVLDRLGTPTAIAAEARERYGTVPAGRAYGWDVAAVVLLLLGAFLIPVVGWLVGVVLLWSGPRWTLTDRLLGTLIWPFGYPGLLVGGAYFTSVVSTSASGEFCLETTIPEDGSSAGSTVDCSTPSGQPDGGLLQHADVALFVLALVAPLVVAVHLLRRARPA